MNDGKPGRASPLSHSSANPMPPKPSMGKINPGEQSRSASAGGMQDLFSIPTPIKKLFDLVPVVIYPSNSLPRRAPKSARIPRLYVFSNDRDCAAGKPSFNPNCLKWQVGYVRYL